MMRISNRAAKLQLPRRGPQSGFTLLELLAASALFSVLLLVVFQMVDMVSRVYTQGGARIESFSEGRAAFTEVAERLSQATLFPYLDYSEDPATGEETFAYQSDLHFLCGPADRVIPDAPQTNGGGGHAVLFHATRGVVRSQEGDLGALPGLLNATGFYVEFGTPDDYQPGFLNATGAGDQPSRFRLVEILQPTEDNMVYEGYADGTQAADSDGGNTDAWIEQLQLRGGNELDRHVLADNIIALVIRPKDPAFTEPSIIAPDYRYDSRRATSGSETGAAIARITRHQLPPVVEVILVAIDERSALRLERDWGKNIANVLDLGTYFRSASQQVLEADLKKLGERLKEKDVNYKVFRGDVVLKNSRWREDLASGSGG